MFEYFMPRLLLPAPDGSMSYEALRFCLRCQQRRPRRTRGAVGDQRKRLLCV